MSLKIINEKLVVVLDNIEDCMKFLVLYDVSDRRWGEKRWIIPEDNKMKTISLDKKGEFLQLIEVEPLETDRELVGAVVAGNKTLYIYEFN